MAAKWKYETYTNQSVWRQDGSLRYSISIDDPEIQAWIRAGNTPDAADPSPPEVKPSQTSKFQKVIDKINSTALPAATKTALIDIFSALVDNS